MSANEWLVVVVFFLIGYWVVDFVWAKKKPGDKAKEDRDPPGPANP